MIKKFMVGLIALMVIAIVGACSDSTTELNPTQNAAPDQKETDVEGVASEIEDEIEIESDSELAIQIDNAWLLTAKEGSPTEVYMTIKNDSELEDSLTDVLITEVLSLRSSAEFYNGEVDDSNYTISIEVPAGETIELAPDKYFIFIEEVGRDLNEGDEITVDLHFLQLGDVSVKAMVRGE